MEQQPRRRTRRRGRGADGGVAADATAEAGAGVGAGGNRRTAVPARERADRGLRDLVGAGPSQLGVSGALRGRDLNRPTEEDLARAEREVVVVRRHWTPPEG